MARKFVSGVLAFAMVFGATAPVVFAEPVATEVVDQDANYIPTTDASVTVAKWGEGSVTVKGLPADAHLNYDESKAGDTALSALGNGQLGFDFDEAKQTLKIFGNGFSADTKVTLVFFNDEGDYFAPVSFTVKFKDEDVEYWDVETSENDGDHFESVVGVGTKINVKATNGQSGEDKKTTKVDSITARAESAAADYFTVSVEDVKDSNGKVVSNNVVITPKKATPADKEYEVQVAVRANDKSAVRTIRYYVSTVASPVSSVKLTALQENITTADTATLVAQAYYTDKFGELTQVNNLDSLKWFINGKDITELTDGKYESSLSTSKYVKLVVNDGVATFTSNNYTGTFRITVTDATGDISASKSITVTAPTEGVTKIAIVDKDGKEVTDTNLKNVQPGATVNMADYTYAGFNGTKKINTVAALGGKLTYTLSYMNGETEESVPATVAKIDKNTGVITTIAGADMDEVLARTENKNGMKLFVKATADGTYTGLKGQTVTYTVTVAKPAKKAAKLVVTDGTKQYTNKLGEAVKDVPVVVSVGTPVTYTATVYDEYNFSDAVAQTMIWTIEGNTDKVTYATVSGGVVTPLVESAGTATLVGVSTAEPSLQVRLQLYITAAAATPTATPTATATPAPTATTAPTAAPTTAPATKTGKVTASSLRVRETPVNGTVVGKLAKGTAVTITEEKDGWYKVTAGTLNGWVSGEYVELTTPSTTETAKTTANLKLRKTAKTGSVITTMPKGSKVEVLEKGSEWSKVKYNGKTGYASNAYLEFEEDAVG